MVTVCVKDMIDEGDAREAWAVILHSIQLASTPDHIHLDFGQSANAPADYGTCDPAEVTR
jgi:hypothetical protein